MARLLSDTEARFLRFAEDYAGYWEKFLGPTFCAGHWCTLEKTSLNCTRCLGQFPGSRETYRVGKLQYCITCWPAIYLSTEEDNLYLLGILGRMREEYSRSVLDICSAQTYTDYPDCMACGAPSASAMLSLFDKYGEGGQEFASVHLSCLSGKMAKSAVY
jgi:hypothetical protein